MSLTYHYNPDNSFIPLLQSQQKSQYMAIEVWYIKTELNYAKSNNTQVGNYQMVFHFDINGNAGYILQLAKRNIIEGPHTSRALWY